MTLRRPRRARMLPAFFACFCAGAIVGWLVRDKGPPIPRSVAAMAERPQPTAAEDAPSISAAPAGRADRELSHVAADPGAALESLNRHDLRLPIDGTNIESWQGKFAEPRDGRTHEAVDIIAARNTPVHAVEDGTVAKLFESKAGGHTIYQFDPSGRFCYYYAHLERYEAGLAEGQRVSRGQIIGYVGTSGNAPPGTPHLHFTIFELTGDRRWWQGRAIDPYLAFKHQERK
jgi:murein DD-endopeptidase MepM/ murein hydrolase activator NlpD